MRREQSNLVEGGWFYEGVSIRQFRNKLNSGDYVIRSEVGFCIKIIDDEKFTNIFTNEIINDYRPRRAGEEADFWDMPVYNIHTTVDLLDSK